MPRSKKIVATPDAPSVGTIVTAPPNRPSVPPTPPNAKLAYDRVVPEMLLLKEEEVGPINLDISQAVALALSALPGIKAHEADLAKLPGFDMRYLKMLETYAFASWYAHLQALPAVTQTELKAYLEEATALRNEHVSDGEVMVRRGIFNAEAMASVRAGQGHVDLANDLTAVSAMYELAWEAIGGRTFITRAQVERAGVLGPRLLVALGARAYSTTEKDKPGANRARAYTLFSRAYNQVRRALAYLRWEEGDAESIAPSLYRTRANRAAPGRVVEEESGGVSDGNGGGDGGHGAMPALPTAPVIPPPAALPEVDAASPA